MGDNKNYIFFFGDVSVGKSTLMATIFRLLSEKGIAVIPNPKKAEGKDWFYDFYYRIIKGQFPNSNPTGKIIEIDLGLKYPNLKNGNKEDGQQRLIFLEMAGADLNLLIQEHQTEMKKQVESYLKIADLFVIVTDVKQAINHSAQIHQFLIKLIEKDLNQKPILLILSKWDSLEMEKRHVPTFCHANLPLVTALLMTDDFGYYDVFDFSIGRVNQSENIIDELDLSSAAKIYDWIAKQLPFLNL